MAYEPDGSADTEALGVAANGATDGLEVILGGAASTHPRQVREARMVSNHRVSRRQLLCLGQKALELVVSVWRECLGG